MKTVNIYFAIVFALLTVNRLTAYTPNGSIANASINHLVASIQSATPVLLTKENTTRAIAVDAVTFSAEPFSIVSPIRYGVDQYTRISVFALNLSPEPLSSITAEAEDNLRQRYPLAVEYAGQVPAFPWITHIILKLNASMREDCGDVLVGISQMGQVSNRARVGIGHIGGGLPDDVPMNQPPSIAITSPSSGAVFTIPTDVTLRAIASDVDGTISRVDFFVGTNLIASDSSVPFEVTLGNVPAGSYTVTARAYDNGGATASSSSSFVVNGVQGFFVAPNGSSSGDGSLQRPWDLPTALSQPSVIQPNTTIWLRGGTYRGTFRSELSGTSSGQITVRSYPAERATIDGSITIAGNFTTFMNLEVTNSSTNRDVDRSTGIDVLGAFTKLINLIVHDTGNGIGMWSSAIGAEAYGNIIYNCGMNIPGYAHGIYVQNQIGTKLIRDNVIFNQFGYGIHAYGEQGSIKNIRFEGNVSFDNGILNAERHFEPNIFVGGSTPAEDISIVQNFTYQGSPGISRSANVQLYYRSHENRNLVLTDNYIVGGNFEVQWWQSLDVTGNTVYSQGLQLLTFAFPSTIDTQAYRWDNNTYFYLGESTQPFVIADVGLRSFQEWQNSPGFDRNGRYFTSRPSVPNVFLRPNLYEPGRAHIVVYNWDRRDFIEADLNSVLRVGDRYEVRNVQDYWRGAILTGTYDGMPLRLPMTGLTVATPVGQTAAPPHTGPDFSVFLLRRLP